MPPHAYFVVSAVFHYLGPSFDVLLYPRVEVLGVAWLRIASRLICALAPPLARVRRARLEGRRLLVAWGCVALRTAASISRSAAAAGVAAISSCRSSAWRRWGAHAPQLAARARGGRGSPRDRRQIAVEPLGVTLRSPTPSSSRSTSCWPIASPSGRRSVASTGRGLDADRCRRRRRWRAGRPSRRWAVRWRWRRHRRGVSSSVIPYVTDQLALARLARARYASGPLLPAMPPSSAWSCSRRSPRAGRSPASASSWQASRCTGSTCAIWLPSTSNLVDTGR